MKKIMILLMMVLALTSCKSTDATHSPEVAEKTNVNNETSCVLWIMGNENWSITQVVGATEGSKWEDDDSIVGQALDGSEVYHVYSSNHSLGAFEGTVASETALMTQEVTLTAEGQSVNFYSEYEVVEPFESLIAIEGAWNVHPRSIEAIDVSDQSALVALLSAYNYQATEYKVEDIGQVYVTDLDQDGGDELLILESNVSASDFQNDVDKQGKYARISVLKKEGDTYSKLPIVDEQFEYEDYWYYLYHIANILDINGDGKLEIVVESEGSEENALEIFEMNHDEFNEVLSCYYGV